MSRSLEKLWRAANQRGTRFPPPSRSPPCRSPATSRTSATRRAGSNPSDIPVRAQVVRLPGLGRDAPPDVQLLDGQVVERHRAAGAHERARPVSPLADLPLDG